MIAPLLHNKSQRRLFLGAGTALLLAAIMLSAFLIASRQAQRAADLVQSDLEYRSRLYEAYVRTNVLTVDQTLQTLRAEILETGVPNDLRDWVASRSMLRDPVIQIGVTDRRGMLFWSSEPGGGSGIDLSDRRHVAVQLEATDDNLFFSAPLIGRVTRRLSINVTRPVIGSDGKIEGVVIASVNPGFFSPFFRDLSFRSEFVAKVIGTDGVVRVRSDRDPKVTEDAVADPEIRRLIARRFNGTTTGFLEYGGPKFTIAHRSVEGYDLHVLVALDEAQIEHIQASEARQVVGVAMLFSLLVIAMAVAFDRISEIHSVAAGLRARAEEREDQIGRMGALLADCDAIMLRIDRKGLFLDANPAFRKIFPDLGAGWTSLGAMPIELKDMITKVTSDFQFPLRIADYIKERDGATREFIWSWIKCQGETADSDEFLGVAIDHTELRRKELMLIHASKLTSLGRQSASICHELAQPLNVVSLGLDNLRNDWLTGASSEAQIKRFERLIANIRKAGRILDRFRTLARAPSLPLAFTPLRAILDTAIESVADRFTLDGVMIRFEAAGDPSVRVNVIDLEQVFVNILMNARDAILSRADTAGREGLVVVKIGVSGDGENAEVEFRDNGCGLPQELLSYGIRPFASTKRDQGGIGLGLAISEATIRAMGGELTFEGHTEGAIFRVRIPMRSTPMPAEMIE